MEAETREGLLSATWGVLVAAAAGAHYGELHELLTSTSTVCQGLLRAGETYTVHQLAEMIRWAGRTLPALRGREGKEAEAARWLVGLLGRLAADALVLSSTGAEGRPC